jgi:very-short-patch-repair endonuclease
MYLSKKRIQNLIEYIDTNDISTLRSILELQLNKAAKVETKSEIRRKKKLERVLEREEKVKQDTFLIANSFRSKLVDDQTEPEKTLKALLKSINIEYEFQKIFYYLEGKKTRFYIVDFYLPKYNIGIEVDGKYHEDRKQKSADKKRTRMLKASGIREIVRFTNYAINTNLEFVKNSLLTNKHILKKDSY